MVLVLINCLAANAQSELNFTQYINAPLLYNPASNGDFDGTCRATGLFSEQWRTWQTITASYEHKLPIGSAGTSFLNVGGAVYQDMFSISNTNFRGAVSIQHKFNNHEIIVGAQPIFNMIKSQDLTTKNQPVDYDPTTGTFAGTGTLDPSITAAGINENYFNLNAGVLWNGDFSGMKVKGGTYMANILQPNISYIGDQAKLSMKLGVHGSAELAMTSEMDLMPLFLIENKLSSKETKINMGSLIRYKTTAKTVKHIVFGPLVKTAGNITNVSLYGGMNFGKLDVNASFDFNGSPSQLAGANGFELSLIYTCKAKVFSECYRKVCPRF